MQLDRAEQRRLLVVAREAIEAAVSRAPAAPTPATSATGSGTAALPPRLSQPAAAFVTIHEQGQLRGCIGLMRFDEPLWLNVRDAARAAALEDRRFMPVVESELPALELEVSVLEPPVDLPDPEGFIAGRHGIIVLQDQMVAVIKQVTPSLVVIKFRSRPLRVSARGSSTTTTATSSPTPTSSARRRPSRSLSPTARSTPERSSAATRPTTSRSSRSRPRPLAGHVRRLLQALGRRLRPGHGQSARPPVERDRRHRQRPRPPGQRAHRQRPPRRHPDQRRDQPRQQRRRPRRSQRPGRRHPDPRGHRPAGRRRAAGHRLRHLQQPGQDHRRPAHRRRQGHQLRPRLHGRRFATAPPARSSWP
jgi:AmmeMemoRadiSam system protein A